ncbi:hypothetical protein [Rhodoferax sp. UBA5149]|uniref:hypothetical protein n=1 Tax=Rhodoferax sp. UBA5149 TaxID=1947379 RepID=UPI0025EB11CB|nr:hypothetical protein [Rhodoferax sp. UBA5149]
MATGVVPNSHVFVQPLSQREAAYFDGEHYETDERSLVGNNFDGPKWLWELDAYVVLNFPPGSCRVTTTAAANTTIANGRATDTAYANDVTTKGESGGGSRRLRGGPGIFCNGQIPYRKD